MSEIYCAPDATRLASTWGLRTSDRHWHATVGIGDTAPIITRHGLQLAQIGLPPRWTANDLARATLSSVPIVDASTRSAVRSPFERRRWCVIPALAFFLARSHRDAGRSELWRFTRTDLQGFGIAGLYERWRTPADGREVSHFAMLTVDSCAHPLLAGFGRVRDARSGVVSSQAPLLLDRAHYDAWLQASTAEALEFAEQGLHGELSAEPPPRQKLSRSTVEELPASERGSLVGALSQDSSPMKTLSLLSLTR